MLHFRAPPVGLGLPPSKLCLAASPLEWRDFFAASPRRGRWVAADKGGSSLHHRSTRRGDDKRFSVLRWSVTGVALCSQVTEALGAAGDAL